MICSTHASCLQQEQQQNGQRLLLYAFKKISPLRIIDIIAHGFFLFCRC